MVICLKEFLFYKNIYLNIYRWMILSMECVLKEFSIYKESRWKFGWNKRGYVLMVINGI